jgi:hypothetical protein
MATREQVDLIRKESREGKTANQIQKDLQSRHMGMRRTQLLGYVREIKGKQPKPEQQKYTPRKVSLEERVHRQIRERQRGKKVSVYGKVNGESRRIQMYGSGRDLYRAMMEASKYPPKKKFLTCSADDMSGLLDYWESWDQHPNVES